VAGDGGGALFESVNQLWIGDECGRVELHLRASIGESWG
jgi:hypothetical protein